MYYADSDLLSILLAIITIAAGIYSSTKKKSKGEDIYGEDDLFQEDDFFQRAESIYDEMPQEQVPVQEETRMPEEDKLPEEGVPQTVVQAECKEKEQNSLKSRLKASPKDAILFSEILKPKYKEF